MERITQEGINKKLWDLCERLRHEVYIQNFFASFSALLYCLESAEEIQELLQLVERETVEKIEMVFREKCKGDSIWKDISFKEWEPKILKRFLIELREILEEEQRQNLDLQQAYQYCIQQLAIHNVVHTQGVLYQPTGVRKMLLGLIKEEKIHTVYDPCCGTGSFLLQSLQGQQEGKYLFGKEEDNLKKIICKTNMTLAKVKDFTFYQDDERYFDVILSNPPFTIKNQPKESGIGNILLDSLEKVKDNGIITMIVPTGFLFRESEKKIRQYLIQKDYLDAVIELPVNLFYETKTNVAIIILKKQREFPNNILFIDATQEYKAKRKINILEKCNQEKIIHAYKNYRTQENFCYLATKQEIKIQDYSFMVRRYLPLKPTNTFLDKEEMEQQMLKLEEQIQQAEEEIREILQSIKDKNLDT